MRTARMRWSTCGRICWISICSRLRKAPSPATVTHINAAGPKVKIELISHWGDPVQVEIDHDRYHELKLERDAEVYLSPRENHVFVYQI